LERLGVALILNRPMTRQNIVDLDAEVVMIATGALDACRSFAGDGSMQVISAHELLCGAPVSAAKTLVLSEGRGQAGLVAGEVLLHQSIATEIVTSDIAVAADLDPTNRAAWYQRLGERDCKFTAAHVVESVNADTVLLRNVFDDRLSKRKGIDLIVDWSGCRANDELIRGWDDDAPQIFSIGDCRAPRTVEVAISEASALANRI